jgi:hypothetical protein
MEATLKAANVDDRRRVVLPFPAGSAVVIQAIDSETVIVKRQRQIEDVKLVVFRKVERLPSDPEWEAVEHRLAKELSKRLPEPDFE